jgi:putative photosynthetic complex assembly protein
MSDPIRNEPFPRRALLAVAALIGFSLIAVTAARIGGLPTSQVPPSPEVLGVDLRFEDRADGAVLVQEGETGATVATLAPGTNGFVRGVLRSLVRERRAHATGEATPFRLARHADGRLTLADLATGRVIELNAFGADNLAAFAALLTDRNRVAAH